MCATATHARRLDALFHIRAAEPTFGALIARNAQLALAKKTSLRTYPRKHKIKKETYVKLCGRVQPASTPPINASAPAITTSESESPFFTIIVIVNIQYNILCCTVMHAATTYVHVSGYGLQSQHSTRRPSFLPHRDCSSSDASPFILYATYALVVFGN